MNKGMVPLIILFGLSIYGCVLPHQEETVIGSYVSKSEARKLHYRSKSDHRHIDLTKDQIEKINKLLGRKISFTAVNYKRLYKKRGGSRIGAAIGNHYKIEKQVNSEKIVLLLGIHKGRIAEIEFMNEIPKRIFMI